MTHPRPPASLSRQPLKLVQLGDRVQRRKLVNVQGADKLNDRVRVRLHGETPLRVGMTTEVNIIIARHEAALLLPAAALVDGRVWVVRGKQIAGLPVQTGIRSEKGVEIRSGIDERDLVVAQPTDTLRAARRVRAKPAGR